MIKKIKDFLLRFKLFKKLNLIMFRSKFRRLNRHNFVNAQNKFSLDKVKIGKYTYGNLFVEEFGVLDECLEIGSFCSIANNVVFILSGEHNYKTFSTYPFKSKIFNEQNECFSKGKIVIKDDVWIGYGATILSGVTIGQGAIIGAGSVVTKDVPPYAIYANGKIIKYRFNDEIINKLLKINYDKLSDDFILTNFSSLYEDLNEDNVDKILDKLDI